MGSSRKGRGGKDARARDREQRVLSGERCPCGPDARLQVHRPPGRRVLARRARAGRPEARVGQPGRRRGAEGVVSSDYRRIAPGSCSWCGHPPHDAACGRSIRTAASEAEPCPCARRNR
jgi:hypothetical protein